ncbi:MAG: murein biosynthesis integral membrane protein MurJ [Phycisphaerales bacterium]
MTRPESEQDTQTRVLAGAIRLVSGLTLLSRFSGLARDLITARLFGDGLLGSAFRAAYTAPNLFRRLFGEGALSAAFLPEYARAVKDDRAAADALASLVVAMLTLVTSALVVVIELALIAIIVLAPNPERNLSLKLVLVMLPMMPMVCLTAILGGMLQAHGRFGPPAAAPILLNLFQVGAAAACWFSKTPGPIAAYVVGASAVLASVAQIAWSLHALRGRVNWSRAWSAGRASSRIVLGRFVPVLIGLGTLQLNTMLDSVVAMWPTWVGPTMFGRPTPLDQASNAILSYTQTLYQFPLGVFGLAVATAVFPLLARTASDPAAFDATIRRGLRLSFFIGLPASIGLFSVRRELCEVLFGGHWGGFAETSILRCADTLAGFSLAVWAYSLNHVFARAFYARGDTVTPMRVAMGMVALNLCLNLALIWPFKEAGLAWATACSAVIQCILLGSLCRRKLAVRPFNRETAAAFARIAGCALAMAFALALCGRIFPPPTGWVGWLGLLVVKVIAGAGAYGGLCLLLRAPEIKWVTQRAPKGPDGGVSGMSFE